MIEEDELRELSALARKAYLRSSGRPTTTDYRVEVSEHLDEVTSARVVQIDTERDYRYFVEIELQGPRALKALAAMLRELAGD
jgi:hypothetical protein